MRGKWLLFAGIAILLALAAGALTEFVRRRAPEVPPQSQTAAPAASNPAEVSLPGKIRARNVVPVPSPVDGIIDEMFVDVGQEVFQGQLLARIRSGRLESAHEAAAAEAGQAQTRVTGLNGQIVAARLEETRASSDLGHARDEYDLASKAYQRQQLLYREGATPRLVFERTENEYNAAKAAYESQREIDRNAESRLLLLNRQLDAAQREQDDRQRALEDAQAAVAGEEIHAPVDGLIVERKGRPGEEVSAAAGNLFQVATDLQQLQVLVDAPPNIAQRIKRGQPAGVRIAEVGEELPGTVSGAQDGGQVVIDFVSPTPAVHPGLTAQVRIGLT
jgi:multidrug resistance efflux pump